MGSSEEEQLDALCKRLYEASSSADRMQAERALNDVTNNPDCFHKCMLMLEAKKSSYSQLFASSSLLKLISRPSPLISLSDRIELRSYLLNYLINNAKLPAFVLTSICQLYARMTKLGWFETDKDEFVFRQPIEEILAKTNEIVSQKSSVDFCNLCRLLQLLGEIIVEMNQCQGFSSISKHRKVAASFREGYLFDIFQMVVSILQTVSDNVKVITDESNEAMRDLVAQLLTVALHCLTFDFIGSVIDDTSDETTSVQVPTTWRVAFADCSIIKLFFSFYTTLPVDLLPKTLACLVQLASIRRTILNNTERQNYISALLTGVKTVFDTPQATYHEFCRLVARLKANYQLTELIKVDDYDKVMQMLTEFTVTSLQMHEFSSNSVHYLLSFWQRLVSSMPYVKSGEPHHLEQYAPLVTEAYIQSRQSLVQSIVRDKTMEDALDDHACLSQQMEQMAVICRCEYDKTAQLLLKLFDQAANEYQQALNSAEANSSQWQDMCVGHLTWLVRLIGAAVGGRVAFSTSEEHDLHDGDLICRVLELMRLTDSRLSVCQNERLEFAYLWHLEQFRKIYISDQVQKTSKVYDRLSSNLGLSNEAAVLAVFVRKIITNLKYWTSREKLISETLKLLNELAIGYTSVRKLVQLPEIQYLLNNHTAEEFSLLGTSVSVSSMRSRTTFYTALTRLMCIDLADDDDQFQTFMQPLTAALSELTSAFANTSANVDQVKLALIGLCRDVRGVAHACNQKIAFSQLFDWLYPDFMSLLHRGIGLWYADPDVTSPVLKLMCELCQNRSQRLHFDVSSPNAILLFKEASKLICEYGSNILPVANEIPKQQAYPMLFKGISTCFSILKVSFSGSYVNFGVFHLYGDSCLQDVLAMFVKMLLVIPQDDIQAYSKLCQNYYQLLECIATDHVYFLSNLEPDVFAYILQTLHSGLTALDTMVCTGCCSTLDLIATYLYKRMSRRQAKVRSHVAMPLEGDNCLRTLEQQPQILNQMLGSIVQILVFDECRCQWSMSRPLLPLILLQEDVFTAIRQQIIASQSTSRQPAFAACFDALMDGVERNLSVKNKDKFTQNVSVFRKDISEAMKSLTVQQRANSEPVESRGLLSDNSSTGNMISGGGVLLQDAMMA